MTRSIRIAPALVLTVVLATFLGPTHGQTWTGTTSTDWNTASNWSPATVPNSTTAVVNFTGNALGTVNVSATVSAAALNFTNTTGGYTITSSAGQTFYGGGAITVAAGVTGTETLDLANISGGSLVPASTSEFVILTNNSTAANYSLVIGPNTVIGTDDAEGMTVAGAGNTQITGSFASGIFQLGKGLTKTGPGVLDFAGNGSNLAGGITLNGGTLYLDYSLSTATKLGAGALTLGGGQLILYTSRGLSVTQSIPGGTVVAAGHTDVSASASVSGIAITLNAGSITRNTGGTVDFAVSTSNPQFGVATTTGNNNFGLLGSGPAFATVNGGSTWAIVSGGAIAGLGQDSYGEGIYSAGTNTDAGYQTETGITTNSLRFNSGLNLTLTLSGTNFIQSGGILVTTAGLDDRITGGTLEAPGAGELLVHQYALGPFTINSTLVSTAGLTKTGPGTLFLGGNNTGLTGPINVNRGGLTVTTTAAVNSASAINFNDNRTGADLQQFTVDLGTNVSGTISPPINVSAFTQTDYGTYFSTGNSTGSQVTLSGVLSTTSSAATPIRFTGSVTDTSGFNLTNANTFSGNVSLLQGSLGITADASLGNAANTLFLEVGDSVNGGLVFLNSGVTVARPVVLNNTTRIVSNGTDSNTISGAITGTGGLVKDGTGTLTLTNQNNSYSGGTILNAGAVAVASQVPLGLAGTGITLNGGALTNLATFTLTRPVTVNPVGGTFDTNGFNLTIGGTVTGNGTFAKAGAGTLFWANSNYAGPFDVQGGTLQLTGGALTDGATVEAGGTLSLTGVTVNIGPLSMAAGAGGTINYNGGTAVLGGYLRGPGTHVVNGATLTGVSTFNSTVISETGPASFVNFSNGGALNVAAGLSTPGVLNGFINQGSASITVGPASAVNVVDFQTYGLLTLNPGPSSSAPTLLTNTGSSPMYFNGGSRTFLGTAATAINPATGQPADLAGINLNGQNAVVAGGLFVNNGFVADGSAAGTATIIADFGSLVKGAGFFQNSVITQNGGKFQAGNSPGSAAFGSFVFGPGGVGNYVFAIDDATGMAGPSPDALGHVSGWGLVKAIQQTVGSITSSGDFTWTATSADKLTVAIDTLINPTTVGTDVTGPMADFDPTRSYVWSAVKWTGTYSGPIDTATLNADTAFDASGFANPINGTFGWSLEPADQTLSLTYTPSPVPEPGTPALVGLAAAGLAGWRRRGQPTCRPHSDQA